MKQFRTRGFSPPYIFDFTDLEEEAVRIEYPAGPTAGGVLDLWMRPVLDLGLTGPDQGQAGIYIVVGPEDDPAKYEPGARAWTS